MTPTELTQSRARLREVFPTTPPRLIDAILSDAIAVSESAGEAPTADMVEAVASDCLRLRDSIS